MTTLAATLRSGTAMAAASILGALAFTWPLLTRRTSPLAGDAFTPVLLGVLLFAALLAAMIGFGQDRIDARTLALLGILSAVGTVLRPLSAGSAGVEFVFFFIILGGRAYGAAFGFLVGAVTLFVSAIVTGGIGPWLPYQMMAAAWMGAGAGLLPRTLRGRAERLALAGYAAFCGLAYGQVMNLSFWPFLTGANTAVSILPGAGIGENLRRFAMFSIATSLGWDLMRATVLGLGIGLLARPTLKVLRTVSYPPVHLDSGTTIRRPSS